MRTHKHYLLASAILLSVTTKAQVCFTPPHNFPVGILPNSIAYGDFNGDGDIDLVTANQSSYDLSVLSNNGDGTFAPAKTISAGAFTQPVCIITNDLNGDGYLDIATANLNGSLSIFINDGTGAFALPLNTNLGSGGNVPYALTGADFDGDGDTDIATANRENNNITLMLNNGTGSFSYANSFNVGIGPESIVSADFDSDGYMDVATANDTSDNVSILIGKGAGGFATAVNYAVGNESFCITAADLNGDGDIDLATANKGSSKLSILFNNGSGSFYAAVSLTAGFYTNFITTGDYNGDGNTDLAALYGINENLLVFAGDGLGDFSWPATFILNSPSNLHAMASADFDGDGLTDIATANYWSASISVLLNNVPNAPQVTYSFDGKNCGPGTVDLEGGGTNLKWYTDVIGGSFLAAGFNFTTPFITSSTTFYVDETDAITHCVSARVGVLAEIVVIDTTIQQANEVLTANESNATSYQWIDCNDSNAIMIGQVNQVFIATENGSYAAIITVGNCTDTTECTTVNSIVGIGENEIQPAVAISPNPTTGTCTLSHLEKGTVIEVLDVLGRVIIKSITNQTSYILDLSAENDGFYFIRLTNEAQNQHVLKVVKN